MATLFHIMTSDASHTREGREGGRRGKKRVVEGREVGREVHCVAQPGNVLTCLCYLSGGIMKCSFACLPSASWSSVFLSEKQTSGEGRHTDRQIDREGDRLTERERERERERESESECTAVNNISREY